MWAKSQGPSVFHSNAATGGNNAVSGVRHVSRLAMAFAAPIQAFGPAEVDRDEVLVERRLRDLRIDAPPAADERGNERGDGAVEHRRAGKASAPDAWRQPVVSSDHFSSSARRVSLNYTRGA